MTAIDALPARLPRRLIHKLLVAAVLIEVVFMSIIGAVYYRRFAEQIDARHQERLETATRLIARNRLNLTSLTDRETMSLLLGSDLVDAMVVTDGGVVAFSLNPAWRKRKASEIPFLSAAVFDARRPEPVIRRESDGGRPYLVGTAPLQGPGESRVSSFLYFRVDGGGAQREKAAVALLLLLGLAVTALATSAALIWASDRVILARIARLADAAHRVQAGDLTVRSAAAAARPGSRDEIDVLQHDFDSMVERLQRLVAELEERVAVRTRDLAAATDAAEAARQRAENAAQAKTVFFSMMSHELRTPLNGILGYAQILQLDDTQSEQTRRGLGIIRQSGDHLLALINDILDISKAEAGGIQLAPQPVPLVEFVRSVADIVAVRAEQKQLRFTLALDPALATTVSLDPKRMRQVLLNLLSNAVKFTDDGEVLLRVERVAGRAQTEAAAAGATALRFAVVDSGSGMSEAQTARLFRPFEQLGTERQRSGGSGLGLVIAGQIVRAMGSTIELQSAPGQGTRFWFDVTLPLA